MAISKLLHDELVRVSNAPFERFLDEPEIEDPYLRDRLGGDYTRLGSVEKDLHVKSCLERRGQAISARDRKIRPASQNPEDVAIATLSQWVIDNLPWDEVERKLWKQAYIGGRGHAEMLWETRPTPRSLVEGEFEQDDRTGTVKVIRPPYPYPWITVPREIRNRKRERFVFRPPSKKVRQVKDPSQVNDLNPVNPDKPSRIKLPPQQIMGWELRILTKDEPIKGEPAPIFKFIHHSFGSETSNPNGKGVGGDLFWPVTLKREFVAFWAIYADKYAEPGKYGTYPDGEDGSLLEEFFTTYGRNSWASLPEGYKVHLLEAARAGSINTYESFMNWIDGQISELITGQAYGVAATQGLSGAPAKNDEEIRQEWVKADSDLICPSMRKYLFIPLTVLNIPTAEPPQYWRDFDDQEDLNERSDRDDKLFKQGYRLKPSAVVRIYGDDYEDIGPTADPRPDPDEGQPRSKVTPEGDGGDPGEGQRTPVTIETSETETNETSITLNDGDVWKGYGHWLSHHRQGEYAAPEGELPQPYLELEQAVSGAFSRGLKATWDLVLPVVTGRSKKWQSALAEVVKGGEFRGVAAALGDQIALGLASADAVGRFSATVEYLPDRLEGEPTLEALTGLNPDEKLSQVAALAGVNTSRIQDAYSWGEELARASLLGLVAWVMESKGELAKAKGEKKADQRARVTERAQQAGWLVTASDNSSSSSHAEASRGRFASMTLVWSAYMAGFEQVMNARDVIALYPYSRWRHRTNVNAREHHRKLDMLTLSSTDAFWAQYSPPNGYGCRCLKEYLASLPEGVTLDVSPAATITIDGIPVLAEYVDGTLVPLVDDPSWLGSPTVDRNRTAALDAVENRLPSWLRTLI